MTPGDYTGHRSSTPSEIRLLSIQDMTKPAAHCALLFLLNQITETRPPPPNVTPTDAFLQKRSVPILQAKRVSVEF